MLELAKQYMLKYLVEDAIEILLDMIVEDKFHYDAYNLLGICYRMQNKYENSILFYTKAIEIEPTIGNFWSNRGGDYFELKEYELALKDYEKAISLKFKSNSIYYKMAFSAFKIGDIKKAWNYTGKSCFLNEYDERIWSLTYRLQMKIGDYMWASMNIREIIENRGKDQSKLYLHLAKCDYLLAKDDFFNPILEENRTQLSMDLNYDVRIHIDQAFESINKSIELDPNNSNAYSIRALCHSKYSKLEEAENDISKAIELDPCNPSVYEVWEEISNYKL